MDFNGNRYQTERLIQKMANGLLAKGTDLTMGRDVLLYTYQEADELAHHEAWRWLTKASRWSGEHFMRIVDTGAENGQLLVVLQAETGGPLLERLNDLEMTGRKALACVYELSKGIRETRRNRLPECAVDADNLWMDDSGRLRILNYWTQGKHGRHGVPGLALLLYQLGAGTDIPTSSLSAYAFEMNRLFADLPEAFRERAAALACKAYEGMCTLADFQAEIEVLLGIRGEKKPEQPAADARKPKVHQPPLSRTAHDRNLAWFKSIPLRRWQLFASAGFGVVVLLLWLSLSLRPSPVSVDGANPQTTPAAGSASMPASRADTPKPSAPATQMPAATAAPAAGAAVPPASAPADASADAGVQPPPDGGDQVEAGIVPDLIAHTREDAERMAKAAGLRYQFYLEPHAAPKGVVFKQDLTPGAAVKQGDRITFWVSKGE